MKARPIKRREHLLSINDLKQDYLYEVVKYTEGAMSEWYGTKIWKNTGNGIRISGVSENVYAGKHYHDILYFNDAWRFKLSPLTSITYNDTDSGEGITTKSFKNGEKLLI